MSVSPTEDQVVEAVLRAKDIKGAHVGAQVVHEYIKEVHPDWVLSPKRLRQIRRSHNLVPSDDTPVVETKKLNLLFRVGVPDDWKTMEYVENIPASYCVPRAGEQPHIQEYINKIVTDKSGELLEIWNGGCLRCGKKAKFVYPTPKVQLLATPPTVMVIAQPLCSPYASSPCVEGARLWIEAAMKMPENPFFSGTDVAVEFPVPY